ncbi:MAG: archease [Planctomycetes bacterium]|nr:archease [Planctomycetota bacterium]
MAYEVFEHTADVGLRIVADDPAALLAEAGRALLALIVENPHEVRPSRAVEIRVAEDDPAYRLRDWLGELLFRFEIERLLLCEFDVSLGADGLTVIARGETYDPARHRLGQEVKAITYHGLVVRRTDAGWEGEVVVDV